MKRVSLLCALIICTIVAMHDVCAQSPVVASYVPLKVGGYAVQAEVAKDKAQRQKGLMFRRSLGQNQGMLFVYGKPMRICMWMKNTLIPLSAAFIDEHGKIINIERMAPHSRDPHCGRGSVYFVLEMNRWWFKERGIGPGSRISGLPGVKQ